MKRIYTIGHSTRTQQHFLEMLESARVNLLADVRSFPGSRKYPWFNRENLESWIPGSGIEYLHFRELGGRRKVSADSHNTVWRHPAFRGYADYMETEPFLKGIETLQQFAKEKVVAYMCSEAVWWRCHRSMISDYLKAEGWKVLHIMETGKFEEHPFTAPAKVIGGKLVYGQEHAS